MRIRDELFRVSPYSGFDPSSYPEDLQGWWSSDHPVLTEAIRLLRPARVVEVGSWKGRSAIRMALAAKQLGLDVEIVCVDTWLGSPEHWDKSAKDIFASLDLKHGYPHLYYRFLANVVRCGVADIVTPFPTTSENAATIFQQRGIRFDMAYIDAAHEYGPAKRDIELYYGLVNKGGLVIGDDYQTWEGVTRAANDFARERQLRLIGGPGKFVLAKDNKPPGSVLIDQWSKPVAAATT